MVLGIGKVKGQYHVAVIDTTDLDADPDLIPLTGTITFELNVPVMVNTNDFANPRVIAAAPFIGILDSDGWLTTPIGGVAGTVKEVALVANDDPSNNPTNTQYLVTYNLLHGTRPIVIAPHLITVNSGATLDLTMVTPVEPAPPQQTMGIIVAMTQAEFDALTPPEYQVTLIIA
jgi:hypothetical protein